MKSLRARVRSAARHSPAGAGITLRRRRVFQRLALALVPAFAFLGLEAGLRLSGYGHPADFFLKSRIGGRNVFVENDRFGERFFPRGLARTPPPVVFPAKKDSNTVRIFILGESAALGDPEPAFGFGRYLEVLLREKFPGTKFEVICAATTAINSHALLPIARECARRDGDLWVIYMGNNEVVGPFGAGTVFGPRAPPLWLVRASLALKATRTGQLLDALIGRLRPASSAPRSWQGMKMFLEAQSRPDDASRKRTNENFRRNLADILRVADKAGVRAILSTVASNLKDCAPFASLHSRSLTDAQRAGWEKFYRDGIELENAGNPAEAAEKFRQAAAIDGEFAELQFRLGRCFLSLSDLEEAQRCFALARDFDALPFRADSTVNAIIREAANQFANRGVALLDAEKILVMEKPLTRPSLTLFSSDGTRGIPGGDVFYEHVHLNFEGNHRLARAVAEKIVTSGGWRVTNKANWLSPRECDRLQCVTDWDRRRVLENILQRESEPPFTFQLNHTNEVAGLAGELAALRSRMTAEAAREAHELYRQALTRRPDDFLLHGNFAKLLEGTGDFSGAIAEWKRVGELLPHHFGPDFYLGKLLARAGRLDEAEKALRRSLNLRPDTAEVLDELGRVLTREKRFVEAVASFDRALKLQPTNPRIHLHLAEALAAQDRRDEAMASLRRAVELRPDHWESRYLLGVELAARNQIPAAREQFSEAVRLRPDYPLAHLNLGVALAKEKRLPEAVTQFRETLRLDPTNKPAQEYLAKLGAR